MNEQREQMISSLMDGELGSAETEQLIHELSDDSASRHRLERYQLISDTIRKQLPDLLNHRLDLRIREAMVAEAPHTSNIKKFPEPVHTGWRVTGFALAASLAALAVIGVQWNVADPMLQPAPLASATVALSSPALMGMDPPLTAQAPLPVAVPDRGVQLVATGEALTATGQLTPPVAGQQAQWKVLTDINRPRLTEYLINHTEYSSIVPVRDGLMPQVRVVGYDPVE